MLHQILYVSICYRRAVKTLSGLPSNERGGSAFCVLWKTMYGIILSSRGRKHGGRKKAIYVKDESIDGFT